MWKTIQANEFDWRFLKIIIFNLVFFTESRVYNFSTDFRLEKLGKEKAHLNEQLNILTKQTAFDAEKIENLVIQGDIWKSKFLATRYVHTSSFIFAKSYKIISSLV